MNAEQMAFRGVTSQMLSQLRQYAWFDRHRDYCGFLERIERDGITSRNQIAAEALLHFCRDGNSEIDRTAIMCVLAYLSGDVYAVTPEQVLELADMVPAQLEEYAAWVNHYFG